MRDTLTPEIAQLFAETEEKLKDAPVYDLRTLKAVHDYFEFEAANDTDMDAFLHAHIKKAITDEKVPQCVWTVGDEVYGEPWETSCGNAFTLENDGPKENGMKFCCYCGKVLIEQESKS